MAVDASSKVFPGVLLLSKHSALTTTVYGETCWLSCSPTTHALHHTLHFSKQSTKPHKLVRLNARMTTLRTNTGATERLRGLLSTSSLDTPAWAQLYYRAHFNLVDLHDRYFYRALSRHYYKNLGLYSTADYMLP